MQTISLGNTKQIVKIDTEKSYYYGFQWLACGFRLLHSKGKKIIALILREIPFPWSPGISGAAPFALHTHCLASTSCALLNLSQHMVCLMCPLLHLIKATFFSRPDFPSLPLCYLELKSLSAISAPHTPPTLRF